MDIITHPAFSFHPANIFNSNCDIDSNNSALTEIILTDTDKGVMLILCVAVFIFSAIIINKANSNDF